MPRVLIIGYGKMGRIHAQHLSEMGVPWDYHDPFIPGGVDLNQLGDYTHAIIATPIPTHYEVYRKLDAFPGRILIEKPVVVCPEHLHVLDDPRVFAGMCERFNPAVVALNAHVRSNEIVTLEFCRTSLTGDVVDVGIHDLDLFCHLLELRDVPDWWWDGDVLVANADGVEGRFRWPATEHRERTIFVMTRTESLSVDLISPRIDRQPVARGWPVATELAAFLAGDRVDATVAHAWLTRIVNCCDLSVSRNGSCNLTAHNHVIYNRLSARNGC
jgi:hypothetical protein